jgi:hypothetical protein
LPNYPPKLDLSEQDLPKPDVVATADGAKAVSRLPDGSPAEGVVTSVEAAPASPAETRHDEQTSMAGDADPPQQVAVLAVGESEPIPRIVNVPLPTPRPATLDSLRRQRILHRRRQQHDTVNPGVAARQAAPVTGTATGYTPSDATSR